MSKFKGGRMSKFKVGDKVKILQCTFHEDLNDCVHVGVLKAPYHTTVTEVENFTGDNWYAVKGGRNDTDWVDDELELVEEPYTSQSVGMYALTDYGYSNNNKGGIMATLRTIPKQVKRILNANYKAFYKLRWIDSELKLTDEGDDAVMAFLVEKYEKELGDIAKAEVKELEEENK